MRVKDKRGCPSKREHAPLMYGARGNARMAITWSASFESTVLRKMQWKLLGAHGLVHRRPTGYITYLSANRASLLYGVLIHYASMPAN